jgi:PAS domain S-box-containing protein
VKPDTAEIAQRSSLRERAEKQIKESARVPKALHRYDVLELVHGLEVHQVELELQNEELRSSQAEIEASRKKYFDLYDLAPIGYVTLDQNGLIQEANLTAAELFRTERRRLKGVVFARFVDTSCRDDFHRFFRRLFASGKREERELRLATGGQVPLDVLLSGIAVRDDDKRKPPVCQIAITDITVSKTAEERDRLAAIGETAAILAHEVANPLTAMLLQLYMLEKDLVETPERKFVSVVKDISAEVLRLKNLLKDFSRLSRRETYNLQPTSLAVLAQEILAMGVPHYASKRIRVELQVEPDLPVVLADPGKLKQALLNLFKNAEEAMPKGGTLTLRAYRAEEKLMLEIRDSGIGIPRDLNIEKPFTTNKPDGTGLGLMIVREIVARHHGFLSYTSEPGQGTSFFLSFPIAAS